MSEGARQLSRDESAPASDQGLKVTPDLAEFRLYISDHAGREYVLPYKLGREWREFKAFLEEVYARREDEEHLENIRNDKLDVKVATSRGYNIVLPSLWNDLVVPGAHIRIAFWSDDPRDELIVRRYKTDAQDVEYEDVEIAVDPQWPDDGPIPRSRTKSPTPPPPPPPPRSRPRPRFSEDEWFDPIPNPRVIRERTSTELERIHQDAEDASISEGEGEEEEGIDEGDSSGDGNEEESELQPAPEPVRIVQAPIDQDGNELSFTVNTKWVDNHSVSGEGLSDSPKQSRDGLALEVNALNIMKATTVTVDDRSAVQVHVLPGPENSVYSSSVGIRWHHVHGEVLDWNQFRSTCLSIPSLSARLQKVIEKTLSQIEKDHLKTFQSGMFIEPGTILRGDDADKSTPSSVIFACVPHFDIRKPLTGTSASNRLHPPRTLMQSFYPKYPYEPVRERDEEQALRKAEFTRNDSLIHIPSFWMLNINSDTVVTAGYSSLSSHFVKSIEVHEENLKNLGSSITENTVTTLRLTDLNGRTLLFKLDENRSYFQMEQRLREFMVLPDGGFESGLHLAWKPPNGVQRKIRPRDWSSILCQTKSLFIDLSVIGNDIAGSFEMMPAAKSPEPQVGEVSIHSVPPFFQWPSTSKEDTSLGVRTNEKERSLRCLGIVEREMKDEALPDYETTGPVDKTFTSSKYYDSLACETWEIVEKSSVYRARNRSVPRAAPQRNNFHQSVVESKSVALDEKTKKFVSIVHATLKLFVSDINCTTILGKLGAAVANLMSTAGRLTNTEPCAPDPKEYLDRDWKGPVTGKRLWSIRCEDDLILRSRSSDSRRRYDVVGAEVPESSGKFPATLRKCMRCSTGTPYSDPNVALEHLRGHIRKITPGVGESYTLDSEKLKDWIRNDDQVIVEDTLAEAGLILEQATLAAGGILEQLNELADGVKNENGQMMEIYKFPRRLLETFRRLIVFYMAVERSLHFTEEYFNKRKEGYSGARSVTGSSIEVFGRLSDGVKRPLLKAREDLCYMARSSNPNDYWKRISLGPEYICAWLMRKLIVQPLDRGKTVADLYREYLDTLQFQVNHRPGKRLLRSINLLKEELRILSEVNDWQVRLVKNYLNVLNDATYPADIPSRRALFPYERLVLNSCLEFLASLQEDYVEQIERCGPLTESTKQSAEINEEDHGKAILVFTVVTIIFLPLSFVTSYLGMNTSDIRDMNNSQALFWEIAIPLTAVVLGTITFIAYNGDELRARLSDSYRILTGKQSTVQRKRAPRPPSNSSSNLENFSLADEAEYATPKPDDWIATDDVIDPPTQRMAIAQRTSLSPPRIGAQPYAANVDLDDFEILPRHDQVSPNSRFIRPRNNIGYYNGHQRRAQRPAVNPYGGRRTSHAPHGYQCGCKTCKPNVSTYTRVKRDLVLPESIALYGYNWEYDPDDIDYILIKEELDQRQTEQLYRHTKEVREGDRAGVHEEWYSAKRPRDSRERVGYRSYDGYADWHGGGGYTWVKKNGHGRSSGARHVRRDDGRDHYR